MAAIKGRNTKPELMIRRALHAAGFRFRLHAKHLPGKPDLVFSRYKAVIFVHGCFWHRHDCHLFRWPGTRQQFWQEKISRNAANDCQSSERLLASGWRVATIWECAIKGRTKLDFSEVVRHLVDWIQSDQRTFVLRGV